MVTSIFVTERLYNHSAMRRDVFQAIADPVRREIIGLLAHQSLNVRTVADNFEISRPAISKHLKILRECGLVNIVQQGRERVCEIQPEPLTEVAEWVEKYRRLWEQKLDSFENYLDTLQQKMEDQDGTK